MLKTIMLLTGFSSFLFLFGLYLMLTDKKRAIKKRVKNIVLADERLTADGRKNQADRTAGQHYLRLLGRLFTSRSYALRLEEDLLKADLLLRAEEYMALSLIAFVGGGFLGYLLNGPVTCLLFAGVGLIGPVMFLNQRKKRRLNKINTQMGECLAVMTNSLRAGFSFFQTIDQVSKEMPAPLGMEFGRTTREIALGLTAEDALLNMTKRTDSEDLDLMVTAVLIQRQIGGNLAEILDNISNTIKERVRIKGEIRTLTAQARMSGLVIAMLPVILFGVLTVMNPAYMSFFFQGTAGPLMLMGAVVSELFGMWIISRIVKIEI